MPVSKCRCLLVILASCGVTQFACANGAMGLALEMFDYAYWWPYVVATVILEAWMIGRGLGDGWLKAISISLVANLITGMCCPMICVVGMHQAFIGSKANPNPFLNALFLFVTFGFASALVESVVWKLRRKEPSDWVIVRKSLLAHAAGVPLALAILLIPSHPYVGLQATSGAERRFMLQKALDNYLKSIPLDTKTLPPVKDAPDLLRQFGEDATWAAAYVPDYHRFDFGEAKRSPYEWNQSAAGLTLEPYYSGDPPPRLWLLRAKQGANYRGFQIDLESDTISWFIDKTEAELNANAEAVIRLEKENREHPKPAEDPNDSK